jgi:hypothetical protein
LLGGDAPLVAALDRAAGVALSAATGGLSDTVLRVFNAQDRVLRLGRDLAGGLRERIAGAGRVARSQRLEAAHAVLVVTAYFEALDAVVLPFSLADLELTGDDQLRLAGRGDAARDLLDALVNAAPPGPAPHLPSERLPAALRTWYGELSGRVVAFVEGLALWDGLSETGRADARRALHEEVPAEAVRRYEERFAQLSLEVPEFALWTGHLEHRATRADVRYALSRMEALLRPMTSAGAPVEAGRSLASAHRAMLGRPILSDGEASDVNLPTLEDGYVDPDFRVLAVEAGDRPASEEWWAAATTRSDLPEYLVGALTAPTAWAAPTVVLGQPGAGKSVLTKVLAARLPATDFLVVRVVLREVPADADLQDQIELAVRAATGERISWPDLARGAAGAQLVVLLDGFDELLQATGVSQSDYLVKVAAFQQREADLDRPVAVLVTSRIAVADRTRYPDGTVALRLEPFRQDQIGDWIGRWNRHNETSLRTRGLEPFPVDAGRQFPELAAQPLLLLMLALYDAEANALRRRPRSDELPLDESALYEQLLTAFAAREVRRSAEVDSDGPLEQRIEEELQYLSLAAFAMINRRRQWVTEAELDADMVALLAPRPAATTDFRAPLSRAGLALGRFFFVQRAQAVRDGGALPTFEFLHATFGEYLAARLAVRLASELPRHRPGLVVGPSHVDDDVMYALLSFAPLSSRQQLRFVRGRAAHIDRGEREHLGRVLRDLFVDSAGRTEHRFANYQPDPKPVFARHGIYSVNLLLLSLAVNPGIRASELFPGYPDPGGSWHRRALLWRSALNEQEWTDLALALNVRYLWGEADRDLEVRLASEPREPAEPVNLYWHYGIPPGDARRGGNHYWLRPYVGEIAHKQAVSSGTLDSIIRHAIEPLVRHIGPTLMMFGSHDDRATSVAHDLLDLWLTSVFTTDVNDLVDRYRRAMRVLDTRPVWSREIGPVGTVLLAQLKRDVDRVPAGDVADLLETAVASTAPGVDTALLLPTIECALAALAAAATASPAASRLVDLLASSVSDVRAYSPPADQLRTWMLLHRQGQLGTRILPDPAQFIADVLDRDTHGIPPAEADRARAIADEHYQGR